MSSPKHTAGPYTISIVRLSDDSINYAHVLGPKGQGLAQVGVYGEAETLANLDLFVAAPEFFKHVKSLLNGIDTGLVRLSTDADETLATAVHGLRAALDKAEGR